MRPTAMRSRKWRKKSWRRRSSYGFCTGFFYRKLLGKSWEIMGKGRSETVRIWLILVGGLEHVLFFHIFGVSSSQLTFIFFRGMAQPPTRIYPSLLSFGETAHVMWHIDESWWSDVFSPCVTVFPGSFWRESSHTDWFCCWHLGIETKEICESWRGITPGILPSGKWIWLWIISIFDRKTHYFYGFLWTCSIVMLCYVMLSYVMLCYIMLCYVMLVYYRVAALHGNFTTPADHDLDTWKTPVRPVTWRCTDSVAWFGSLGSRGHG